MCRTRPTVLIEMMGTDGNPAKSKNYDARDVHKTMKAAIEHFNKSAKMDAKLMDL